jgi:hypothetical protein
MATVALRKAQHEMNSHGVALRTDHLVENDFEIVVRARNVILKKTRAALIHGQRSRIL